MTASLWSRLSLADGVELQFDTGKHVLEANDLLELQAAVRQILERKRIQAHAADVECDAER